MGIIDCHAHILPKIDDGSSSSNMSIRMLEESAKQGISHIVATPHFYADEQNINQFLIKREASYKRLVEKLEQVDSNIPQLLLGAEVAFFPGIGNVDDLEKLCINGGNVLLLEMPFISWDKRTVKEVDYIIRRGITPIIAHIERFIKLQNDKGLINDLLAMPVAVQVNAEALLSFWTRGKVLKMFKLDEAHLLASDMHNLESRKPNLLAGRTVIESRLGKEYLEKIDNNAQQLLGL